MDKRNERADFGETTMNDKDDFDAGRFGLPMLVAVLFAMLVGGCIGSLGFAHAEPPAQSCSTPAANFATLTACKTATARALVLTATPRIVLQTQTPQATQAPAARATVTQGGMTPTKVTGTEAPGCWVVGQGVRFTVKSTITV